MKKLLAMLLAMSMVFSLAACGGDVTDEDLAELDAILDEAADEIIDELEEEEAVVEEEVVEEEVVEEEEVELTEEDLEGLDMAVTLATETTGGVYGETADGAASLTILSNDDGSMMAVVICDEVTLEATAFGMTGGIDDFGAYVVDDASGYAFYMPMMPIDDATMEAYFGDSVFTVSELSAEDALSTFDYILANYSEVVMDDETLAGLSAMQAATAEALIGAVVEATVNEAAGVDPSFSADDIATWVQAGYLFESDEENIVFGYDDMTRAFFCIASEYEGLSLQYVGNMLMNDDGSIYFEDVASGTSFEFMVTLADDGATPIMILDDGTVYYATAVDAQTAYDTLLAVMEYYPRAN